MQCAGFTRGPESTSGVSTRVQTRRWNRGTRARRIVKRIKEVVWCSSAHLCCCRGVYFLLVVTAAPLQIPNLHPLGSARDQSGVHALSWYALIRNRSKKCGLHLYGAVDDADQVELNPFSPCTCCLLSVLAVKPVTMYVSERLVVGFICSMNTW